MDTSTNVSSIEKTELTPQIEPEDSSTVEAASVDIMLEKMPDENQKAQRLAIFRVIREITSLGLKESKELTNSLPKAIKESVSREEAEEIKKQLESAGATIKIQ